MEPGWTVYSCPVCHRQHILPDAAVAYLCFKCGKEVLICDPEPDMPPEEEDDGYG